MDISRVAIDVYGGDYAPSEIIKGAMSVISSNDKLHAVLIGNEYKILKELSKFDYDASKVTIVNAAEAVGMSDKPTIALRKKNSSMMIGAKLVKNSEADAFVTAGNSGAAMVISMFTLGKIKGISRPAIATLLPTLKGHILLIDAGANVDCKVVNLLEFALMGSVYAKYIMNVDKPRVGLLSNGAEPGKGNHLVLKTYDALSSSKLNFIGNIEGDSIYKGKADVVICDGFLGNVVLKASESIPGIINEFLKIEIKKSIWYKIGFLLAKPAFRLLKRKIDYAEIGGAPLLGINGACIISHGRSKAKAIKNAILKASKFSELKINDKIKFAVENCRVLANLRKAENI